MVQTNQDVIGEQRIKNDNGMLIVADEDEE